MHVFAGPAGVTSMLSLQDIVAFLQSRIMALSLVPDEYASVVRLISWFFVRALYQIALHCPRIVY
jgi:hypothetical protein